MRLFVSPRVILTDATSSNELNAGYAADGYARIKEGGLSVITTT